jgi:hypothetical protein
MKTINKEILNTKREKKKVKICMFISHCSKQRLDYIKELSKHIDIDSCKYFYSSRWKMFTHQFSTCTYYLIKSHVLINYKLSKIINFI